MEAQNSNFTDQKRASQSLSDGTKSESTLPDISIEDKPNSEQVQNIIHKAPEGRFKQFSSWISKFTDTSFTHFGNSFDCNFGLVANHTLDDDDDD